MGIEEDGRRKEIGEDRRMMEHVDEREQRRGMVTGKKGC